MASQGQATSVLPRITLIGTRHAVGASASGPGTVARGNTTATAARTLRDDQRFTRRGKRQAPTTVSCPVYSELSLRSECGVLFTVQLPVPAGKDVGVEWTLAGLCAILHED